MTDKEINDKLTEYCDKWEALVNSGVSLLDERILRLQVAINNLRYYKEHMTGGNK